MKGVRLNAWIFHAFAKQCGYIVARKRTHTWRLDEFHGYGRQKKVTCVIARTCWTARIRARIPTHFWCYRQSRAWKKSFVGSCRKHVRCLRGSCGRRRIQCVQSNRRFPLWRPRKFRTSDRTQKVLQDETDIAGYATTDWYHRLRY